MNHTLNMEKWVGNINHAEDGAPGLHKMSSRQTWTITPSCLPLMLFPNAHILLRTFLLPCPGMVKPRAAENSSCTTTTCLIWTLDLQANQATQHQKRTNTTTCPVSCAPHLKQLPKFCSTSGKLITSCLMFKWSSRSQAGEIQHERGGGGMEGRKEGRNHVGTVRFIL